MTNLEAMNWLLEVDGRLYQTKTESAKPKAWVAVVRFPGSGAKKGKLIVALGGTAEEATTAAEGQWQELWNEISKLH